MPNSQQNLRVYKKETTAKYVRNLSTENRSPMPRSRKKRTRFQLMNAQVQKHLNELVHYHGN